MKKINEYFYTGCVTFFIINLITMIMHILNHNEAISVRTEFNILIIILIIQIALYIMEDIMIKNSALHVIYEFVVSCIIVFVVGMQLNLIENMNLSIAIRIIVMILITHSITCFSLYIAIKSDEKEINNILKK